MPTRSHIPDGFHTVTPYLTVTSADNVIEFAKAVFGAEVVMRMEAPGGGVAHAELRIGDSVVETADAQGEWQPMPASLHVYVPDIDATYKKALAAGGVSLAEPKDQFYGERSASVRDPVGNLWHIATKTENLSVEETRRRAAELFGGSGQ